MLVGSGGREDAVSRRIVGSGATLISVMKHENPSISRLSSKAFIMDELDYKNIVKIAIEQSVDLVFVGPDPVLDTPLVDTLVEKGVKVASPSRAASKIETSKFFMRDLLHKYNIQGNVRYQLIEDYTSLERFIGENEGEFVVKPLGLTGGKGVKVMGEHLAGKKEALEYAGGIIKKDGSVLLEEKLYGEEFSLQVFTDGRSLSPMPIAQDYKRLLEGDAGPNTGGMGSISDADHSLPFISTSTKEKALDILNSVVTAMRNSGNEFRGIMYGQFMDTVSGPRVIEINARFADPESMNVLTILDDNFADILFSIADGTLKSTTNFIHKSTVVKYIVPKGYGISPEPGSLEIEWNDVPSDLFLYYSSVFGSLSKVEMTSSRALAMTGVADTIPEASDLVESNLHRVRGSYYVRHDIGTDAFIRRKVEKVRSLLSAHRS